MEVIIVSDYDEMSRVGGEIAADFLQDREKSVLGLATGSTPQGLYGRLVEKYKEGSLDFSGVISFNLDEYVGLPHEHSQSYRTYMFSNLFDHINIHRENVHIPDGLADDLNSHCSDYEKLISETGGIDLQVLGIGRDGHIGFNEPGSSLCSRTRVVALARETVEDNARFFDTPDDVPKLAVSMGLGTICEAGTCLLLASGRSKAEAVRRCIEGPVGAMTPASVLQMHPDVTAVIDEQAASLLERQDYYRWARQAKSQFPG